MAAFLRLILFVLIAQMAFHLLLRLYLRSQRHERLEVIWDRRHPDLAGNNPARREFIRKAMVRFDKSLKVRLLWLVYILPGLTIAGIVWWVNWQ